MKIVQVEKDFNTIKELVIDKDIPVQTLHLYPYKLPYYKISNNVRSNISYVKDMSIEEIQNAIIDERCVFIYTQNEEDTKNGKEEEL